MKDCVLYSEMIVLFIPFILNALTFSNADVLKEVSVATAVSHIDCADQ